jgi:fumarylacetoacetase
LFTSCFAPRYSATSSEEDSSCPKDGRGWDLLIFEQFTLNAFAAMPASKRTAVRTKIINLLSDQESILFKDQEVNKLAFYKLEDAEMHLPMRIGDFSDFMCARTHVDNVS